MKVEGSIIWTIFREGSGPYDAFKSLGSDLASGNPKTANDNLVAQSSAIVRSVIANSTLKSILTNRQKIKSEVMNGMRQQVRGWGIWLETVEITDVTIMSQSLFQDMQSEYRELWSKDRKIFSADINEKIAKSESDYKEQIRVIDNEYEVQLDEY